MVDLRADSITRQHLGTLCDLCGADTLVFAHDLTHCWACGYILCFVGDQTLTIAGREFTVKQRSEAVAWYQAIRKMWQPREPRYIGNNYANYQRDQHL